MDINRKDFAAGVIFVSVGLLYATLALMTLSIGSALNMGPGYFPLVLSSLLVGLGSIIVLQSFSTKAETPFGVVPWRAVVMLSLATLVFAAFIDDLGMLVGLFLTSFFATLASPQINGLRAALTSLVIALFCTAVFGFGVRLPLPVIGPLFDF